MRLLILATYNIIILAGTVYLVGWQNWNPWWFLFAMACMASYKNSGECKESKPKEEKRIFLKD